MPVHDDRSRVHEARIAGLAIMLSVAALILVVVYVVGGYANRVVVELVLPSSAPAAGAAVAWVVHPRIGRLGRRPIVRFGTIRRTGRSATARRRRSAPER